MGAAFPGGGTFRTVLILAALSVSGSARGLEVEVEVEVEGCGRANPSRVVLRGGGTSTLTVRGPGLDLTRRVSTAGLGSRLDVSIRGRSRGSTPSVTLEVEVPAGVDDGDDGRLVLEAPSGEVSFGVRLTAPAEVESIALERAPFLEGRYRLQPSRTYDVLVKGKRLWDLAVARPEGNGAVSLGSRGDHQLVLHLRAGSRGSLRLSAASFTSAKGCDGRLVVGSGEALATIE